MTATAVGALTLPSWLQRSEPAAATQPAATAAMPSPSRAEPPAGAGTLPNYRATVLAYGPAVVA